MGKPVASKPTKLSDGKPNCSGCKLGTHFFITATLFATAFILSPLMKGVFLDKNLEKKSVNYFFL